MHLSKNDPNCWAQSWGERKNNNGDAVHQKWHLNLYFQESFLIIHTRVFTGRSCVYSNYKTIDLVWNQLHSNREGNDKLVKSSCAWNSSRLLAIKHWLQCRSALISTKIDCSGPVFNQTPEASSSRARARPSMVEWKESAITTNTVLVTIVTVRTKLMLK